MRSVGPSWVTNTDYFNSTQDGYQLWTIPKTGNYQITAYRLAGALKDVLELQYRNGRGAWTQGFFYLTKGTLLLIIVGQQGQTAKFRNKWWRRGNLGFTT